ncbi:FolC bifunctional protein [Atractiella rhizophila]|nr:FolC bifunctional protein [Atractiella rhizophila]
MAARDYKSAVEALNSLQTNHQVLDQIRKTGRPNVNGRRSIDEDREYVKRIGYQLEDLNKLNVIHITGTKGKGSTSAFCDSLLRCMKPELKVGMYTSPHLVAVRERIMIDGRPLEEEKFAKYFWEVWDRLEESAKKVGDESDMKPKPMYFRYLTLLMWHVFLSEKVDASIIEVGIGGTFDSTNIVPKPKIAGITSLGIDHVTVLGKTIPEIADQKGGIYKQDVPAFTVEQPQEGFEVLKRKATEANVRSFNVVTINPELRHLTLGLAGVHQLSNASLAVSMVLAFLNPTADLATSTTPPHLHSSIIAPSPLPPLIVKGLEEVRWPGRCQIAERGRLRWLLDGAHTVESLKVCAEWWVDTVKTHPNRKRVLIFNCTSGRSGESLLDSFLTTAAGVAFEDGKKTLDRFFDNVIFCTNVTYKDGGFKGDLQASNISPESLQQMTVQQELADIWRVLVQRDDLTPFRASETAVSVLPSIEDAIQLVQTEGTVDVLVTGSLHLIGGLMDVAKLI